MKYRNIFLILCLFWIFSSFIACDVDEPSGGYFEYSFYNRTNQIITIELKQSYRLQSDLDTIKQNKENELDYVPPLRTEAFNIYSGDSQKVFITGNSADFSWKTGSRSDNLEVYCRTNGSEATFMTREIGGYYEYEFDNQTRYTITITMDRSYKTPYKNSSYRYPENALSINSKNKTTVYVSQGNSLYFKWTASNASDNPKIYSETIGTKVTFKER